MKNQSTTGNEPTLLIQLALTDDHINRLKSARVIMWGENEGSKTPMVHIAQQLLEVALIHPYAMAEIMAEMTDRAHFLDIPLEKLRTQLLHCPDSHREANGLRVPSSPFDAQIAQGN